MPDIIKSNGKVYVEAAQGQYMPVGSGAMEQLGISEDDARDVGRFTGFNQVPFTNANFQAALNGFGGNQNQNTTTNKISMPSTGDPNLDEMQNKLADTYQKLLDRGLQIDPNVEITPEKAAEFLSQAEKEVEPYYSSQFKLAKENLLYQLGYSEDSLLRKEQEFEKNYSNSLRSLSNTMAERGMAYSGERGRQEQDLAQNAQTSLDEARRQLSYQAGLQTREFARQYGETGLKELGTANIQETPQVLAGMKQFQRTGRELPLYELPSEVYEGLIGEKQREQKASELALSEGYKQNYKTAEYEKKYRTLTL